MTDPFNPQDPGQPAEGGAFTPPPPGGAAFPPPPGGGFTPPPPPGGAVPPSPQGGGFPPPMPGQFGAPPSGYQVYGQGAGLTLAEPGKRILARLIDAAIMIVVFVIPAFIIMFAMAGSASNNSSGFNFGLSAATVVFGLILLLLPTAYEVGMTATRGATVGKMIMKIKVTRADGMPMDIATALRRFSPSIAASVVGVFCCLGSIASLGILIANVIMIFQPTRLSLYDKVGQTVVVPTDV